MDELHLHRLRQEEAVLAQPLVQEDIGLLALFGDDEEAKDMAELDPAQNLGRGHAIFIPADRRQGPGWAPLRNQQDRRGWNDRTQPRIDFRYAAQGHQGATGNPFGDIARPNFVRPSRTQNSPQILYE